MGLVEERKRKRMLERAGQSSIQNGNPGIVERRKMERGISGTYGATSPEGRGKSEGEKLPRVKPEAKTAEEREADINRREKNRSAQYSRLPEVRAGAIQRAEAAGDTDKVRELTRADDVEKWAEEQVKSDSVKKEAQRRYDEEFLRARARGDINPAVAAMKAGDAYLNIYRNAAQETRNNVYNYRQDEKRNEMEGVSSSGEFGAGAEKGKSISASLNGSIPKSNYEKIIAFVNNEAYRGSIEAMAISNHGDSEMAKKIGFLTDKEKDVIRYYAANGEEDKAEEYYKLLERTLNKRVQEAKNKETYKAAYESPVLGAAQNVTASFATPGAYVANAVNAVGNLFRDEYVPTDTSSRAFRGAHMAKESSAGVTERAYDAAGGGAKGELASFLAGTGLSMANFISKAPLGATGAMLAMGADTAGQTTLDVLERGGTAGQALFLSTAAGAIEALTEKMPLDNLFRTAKEVGKKGIKTTIKSVLKQAGMEATEEMVSELANTVLDIAVMREKSEYQQYISELEKNGMSRAEAEKEAFFQYFGKNILMAGAGGAISGFAMGGGASAISGINTNINRNRAGGGFMKTEFSDKITNKQIRALNAIGRALGVNISIGAPTGDGKGAYNGYYENGNIVIAQDAKNPLEVVLSHEVTHHMKRNAPAEYSAFLELAVNASESLSNTEKSDLINRYKTSYSEGTQSEFSDTQALDEIAADFTSRIVKDVKMFDRLAQDNRNVAMRLFDSIKDFIAKVKSTFSGDKAKADTAAQDKYGASISELEAATAQWEKMLSVTETAVASGNINTAGTTAGGERQYSIETNAKGKYVKADRQVVEGKTPEEWGESVKRYINDTIRRGADVQVIADNGDVLTITADSAGKAKFRNYVKRPDGTKTRMTDAEYLTKLNAESHIDELSQISKKGKKDVPDYKNHDFAKDGFNYRTAYFQDFDGKYYKLTLSVGKNGEINTVYNVGKINEAPLPLMAHRPDTKSVGGDKASTNSISEIAPNVNRENSLKTEDLLSPDYGKAAETQQSDTDENSGGASAISGINTNINRKRAGGGFTKTEYSEKITNKQIRALNSIGRALGVDISIGAPTGVGKGANNGYYENGRIVIAQDAKNPLEVVLCHEVTHHMKRTAPAEYNAFLELAVNASERLSNTEKSELIARYKTAYSEGTQSEFSDAQALDEIAADFTSRIVKDITLFDRLAQDNRNVAMRLFDSIKDFITKVKSTFSGDKAKADTAAQDKYGASISELEAATAQWEKMLSVTETAVASGKINTAGTNADGVRMYDLKGKRADGIEVYETSKEVKAMPWKDRKKRFLNLMKEEFFGRTAKFTNKGQTYYARFDSEDVNKNIYGDDYSDDAGKDAKINTGADGFIFELVENSQYDGFAKEKGKKGKAHKEVGLWDYFIKKVQIDGKVFDLIANVRKKASGEFVYSIQLNEDKNTEAAPPENHTKKGGVNGAQTASTNIIPDSSQKSNRENSLKTEDLLSPDYGKAAETQQSDTDENSGEGSYFDETQLDTYYNDAEERAQVIQDKRIEYANSALMKTPNTKKKTLPEKISESVSHAKRKFVNSGDAIRKIAKATKDGHLYAAFNRARSSMNIVSDMLRNKQTNIRGQKVGVSLEGLISPIKEKGDEYYNNFQLYLLHKHNVSRMSLRDTRAEALAQAELELFIKENQGIAAMGETALQKASLWDDDKGFRAKQYLELREKLNRAQNTKNKPIFFDSDDVPLNADESRRVAAELLRKNPDFARDEARVRKYLDNLMQYRVESGLITQEEADYFKKKYPDYVPTYRNTESVQKQMQGKTNIGKTVGRATGGNEPIIPLDVALAEMTKKVVRSGQKNIFANKVFDLFDANSKLLSGYITDVQEGERDVDAEMDSFGEEAAFDNTVTFHKEGKLVELTVTPELFEAFDTLSRVPKEQPAAAQWVRKVNDVYKKLITAWDLTFAARNGLKDVQDALINTMDTTAFVKNLPRAYSEIANGGEMWELYQAAGGLYSSRFEELQNEGITEKNGKIAKTLEKLAFVNMTVEQAPRLAEFMSVIEKGDKNNPDTISDALLAAAEVTTNFGESGTWGKVLNAYYIPFLNPAIQGTAKLARTFTESKSAKQWIALAVKCTILGLGAGFANDLINEDDEDYKNLPDRTKDNYFLFPIGDGKFLRLPKGRVVAALGIVNDRMRDVMKGEKVDAGEALSRIAENVLPENPLNNNIFKAWFDADLLNDESKGRTWYGTDIENETLQSLPAGERFDNSTDYVSKAIGKALGVSPKKLNYILQQYTGGVGRMLLPMITPKEQKGDSIAGKIGYGLLGILTSNFTTDSKLSNRISGEFYDAVDKATQKKNSEKGTLADKVVYKHLNRERNMVGTYSSDIRAAEVDKNLTSKERQAAVRAASAERTAYQKTILENLDKYRASVEKFLKQYPGADEEKKIEYAYREANRALYGEKYAIRANGGADVYKKAEEKVKRGKTTWRKYYEEYFGKTERRYEVISDRFDISYAEFEKIADAISKNSTKDEKIEAIKKLGYKRSIARRIYTLYYDTE